MAISLTIHLICDWCGGTQDSITLQGTDSLDFTLPNPWTGSPKMLWCSEECLLAWWPTTDMAARGDDPPLIPRQIQGKPSTAHNRFLPGKEHLQAPPGVLDLDDASLTELA